MALALSTAGYAFAASILDEIQLISGSSSTTISDNGPGDINPADASIATFSANFNGWDILVAYGTSHAPDLSPFALDLGVMATCAVGGCTQPLDVYFTDVGYTDASRSNGFAAGFSDTQSGSGEVTASAWYSNLNTPFSEQNLIGTIGPFTATDFSSTSDGSNDAVPDYSLTLEEVFSSAGDGVVLFSSDGNISTETPEPSSATLLGALALIVVTLWRRRILIAPKKTANSTTR